jgi:hypothetical protein
MKDFIHVSEAKKIIMHSYIFSEKLHNTTLCIGWMEFCTVYKLDASQI